MMSSLSLSTPRAWLGSALLVAGTAIGAGMLGLPVALAQANFSGACLAILLVWAAMTLSGLLLAWAFCQRPSSCSLSALCAALLPRWLQRLVGALFVFLYGTFLVAYSVGGPPLLGALLGVSDPLSLIGCSLCIGGAITWWIQGSLGRLELWNRLLMGILLTCFVLMVVGGWTSSPSCFEPSWGAVWLGPTLPVVCGAMGFHNIVPQVCSLLQYNRRAIATAILIGTSLVAAVYIIWIGLLFGVFDAAELLELKRLGRPVGAVLAERFSSSGWALSLRLFSLTALLTSQMGVLRSLTDFCVGTGSGMGTRSARQRWLLFWVAAPMVASWSYPGIFFQALEWAGGYGQTMINGALPVLLAAAVARTLPQKTRWLLPTGALTAAFFFWVLLQELPIWSIAH